MPRINSWQGLHTLHKSSSSLTTVHASFPTSVQYPQESSSILNYLCFFPRYNCSSFHCKRAKQRKHTTFKWPYVNYIYIYICVYIYTYLHSLSATFVYRPMPSARSWCVTKPLQSKTRHRTQNRHAWSTRRNHAIGLILNLEVASRTRVKRMHY